MLGKPEEEKELDLITHLDREAFEFFLEKFLKDGKFTEENRDFGNVKKVLTEQFVKIEDPRDVNRRAVDTELYSENHLNSLKSTNALYAKDGLKDEAKFGMLLNAAMKFPILRILTFSDV